MEIFNAGCRVQGMLQGAGCRVQGGEGAGYSHSSCDEATSQLEMVLVTYPEFEEFPELRQAYEKLSRMINNYIDYVENNWRT